MHEYTRQADYDDEALAIRSTETERTDHHTFTDRLNLVWEVTPHHRLGLTGGFSYASSVPDLVSSSLHYPSGASLPAAGSSYASHGELDNHIWQATASYRWLRDEEGSQLEADFDYVDFASDKRYRYDEQTEGAPSAVTTESQHPRNRLFMAETSFTEVLSEHLTLQAGGEYYWRDIRRRTLTAEDGSPSDLSTFRYRGNGAAVYGDAELSLDWFELVGGVRMQWDRVDHFTGGDTRWRRRDYWRLCPNVNATFILEQERGTTLDLAYTRDGSYIPYDMLSPLRIRESEFRYTVGNPELTPSRGYDLDAVLTLRERWTLSYTYSRGEDMIERMTFTDPDDPQQSYEQPVNCSTMGKHMLSLSYAGPLTKWWRVNWELYGTRGFYRYAGITHWVQSGGIYLSNSLRFAPGFGMTVQFSLESPYEHPERRHNAMHNLGATLYKYLCKNRLYLNLEARCLLQNDNVNWMWSVSDGYRSCQRHRSRRSFIFTAAYFFNNYKGKRSIQRTQTLQKITNEYR